MPNETIPQWANHTPEEDTYYLTMFEHRDGTQEVKLDREEYLYLKQVLFKKRGYVPDSDAHANEDQAHDQAAPAIGRTDPLDEYDCIQDARDRSDRRCSRFLIEDFVSASREWAASAYASEIAFLTNVFNLSATAGDLLGFIFRTLNMDADELIGPVDPPKRGHSK